MCYLTGERARSLVPLSVETQVQPAGVDLRVDRVYRFDSPGLLGAGDRTIPRGEELPPGPDGRWRLEPGGYRIRFLDPVVVPGWAVGFCYPRSSLLRMGATVSCGVWDPGYRGRGEALLVVLNPHGLILERSARVAQIVFARLEERAERLYRGVYQGEGLEGLEEGDHH